MTSIPAADGGEKVYEVHIFPEERRGTGEGGNPFDRGPNSMMTNGVANLQPKERATGTNVQVEGATNQMLTVTYKGQEAKKIALTPDTIIVAYALGAERNELKPGINVTIQARKGRGRKP